MVDCRLHLHLVDVSHGCIGAVVIKTQREQINIYYATILNITI